MPSALEGSAPSEAIALPDGRTLGYAEYGDPSGSPVVLFHGMPGSRLFGLNFDAVARRAHARILAADRPGYGTSSRLRRGSLLDHVRDVTALVDALHVDTFGALGVSGGAPFALACAAELPGRVRRCALMSAIGPLALTHGTNGMARANRTFFRLGQYMPSLVAVLVVRQVRRSRASMERLVDEGTSPLPDVPPEAFAVMMADQFEAVRAGSQGVKSDMRIVTHGWGFPLEQVRVPVAMWHGANDDLAPLSSARYVAEHVLAGTITIVPGVGHAGTLACADEALVFLMRS